MSEKYKDRLDIKRFCFKKDEKMIQKRNDFNSELEKCIKNMEVHHKISKNDYFDYVLTPMTLMNAYDINELAIYIKNNIDRYGFKVDIIQHKTSVIVHISWNIMHINSSLLI